MCGGFRMPHPEEAFWPGSVPLSSSKLSWSTTARCCLPFPGSQSRPIVGSWASIHCPAKAFHMQARPVRLGEWCPPVGSRQSWNPASVPGAQPAALAQVCIHPEEGGLHPSRGRRTFFEVMCPEGVLFSKSLRCHMPYQRL